MGYIRIHNRLFDPTSKFDVTYAESGSDNITQTDKDNTLKYIDMLTDKLANVADSSRELYDIQDLVIELLNQFYNGEMTAGKKSTFYKSIIESKLAKLKMLLNKRTGRDINDESLWHNDTDTDLDGNMFDAPIGLDLHRCATEGCSNIAIGSTYCPQCTSKQTTSNIVKSILKARGPENGIDDLPDNYTPGSISLEV